MKNLSHVLLFSLTIGTTLATGGQVLAADEQDGGQSNAVPQESANGIEQLTSQHSVNDIEARLRKALESHGLTLFTVIDHTQGATRAGLELVPTRTVIFGNPKVGTPMMQCQGSVALDLPQKMLIRRVGDETRIEWNDPHYLARRHGLDDCDLPLDKVAKALQSVAREAAGEGS